MANIKSRVQRLEEAEGIGREKTFVILKRFSGKASGLRVGDAVFKRQPKECDAAMEKRVMATLAGQPGATFVMVPLVD
jgi:hypothetical protein